MTSYTLGALVRVTVSFVVDDVPTDPAFLSLQVQSGGGTLAVYSDAVNDSPGMWHKDLLADELGLWTYTWSGLGSQTGEFFVAAAGQPSVLDPNPAIDLTTIAIVKDYVGVLTDKDSATLQLCITAASCEFLWRTNAAVNDGTIPKVSPYLSQVDYTDVLDGSGSDMQFLRHRPIRSVSRLIVNGVAWLAAGAFPSRGWMIDSGKNAIVLRGGIFCADRQNVETDYKAGYDQEPTDIVRAITQLVAVNYRRREWVDLASKSLSTGGATGTTSYRAWVFPPEVKDVIRNYTSRAVV
jgi:hypothetical protein